MYTWGALFIQTFTEASIFTPIYTYLCALMCALLTLNYESILRSEFRVLIVYFLSQDCTYMQYLCMFSVTSRPLQWSWKNNISNELQVYLMIF
ncbi:hypothetical protein LZ32DRAFT_334449 [Colletotrichum eremochloae]|nr:hypothetical protein LZ32DRAFT_334449 [Colletotrichum eremochloae]